jgi:hypothetical protein
MLSPVFVIAVLVSVFLIRKKAVVRPNGVVCAGAAPGVQDRFYGGTRFSPALSFADEVCINATVGRSWHIRHEQGAAMFFPRNGWEEKIASLLRKAFLVIVEKVHGNISHTHSY